MQHRADGPLGICGDVIRFGERWKHTGQSFAIRLVTDRAGAAKQLLARLDLVFLGQCAAGCGLGRCRDGRKIGAGTIAQIDGIDFLAGIDRLVLRAIDFQDGQRALVEGAENRVVDHDIAAGHLRAEFDDGRTASGDQRGLHVGLYIAATLVTHLVKDFADHVKT